MVVAYNVAINEIKLSFLVISGIIGCYQIDSVIYGPEKQNDWHLVNITWNMATSAFTWKNKAGSSWTLTQIFINSEKLDTTKLAVGPDCPYYYFGYRFADLEWKGVPGSSDVSTINGPWEEPYQRRPCNAVGMDFPLSTKCYFITNIPCFTIELG